MMLEAGERNFQLLYNSRLTVALIVSFSSLKYEGRPVTQQS